MQKGRILAIADAPFAPTGYGNQSNAVLSRLAKRGWDVYQLGCNYFPNERSVIGPDGYMHHNGIKVIVNKEAAKGPEGLYGSKESIRELFDSLNPDIVWTLNDFYRVAGLTELGEDLVSRWVHWLPVDNPYGNRDWAHFMNRMRYFVFLSSFGWNNLAQYIGQIPFKDAVYHAVPSDVFYPLPNRDEVRRRHGLEGKFVIVTVGRHQPRKMIFQSAYAVGEWGRDKNDWVWIVKADPDDPAMREAPPNEADLRGIMSQYGCLDKVLFEPKHIDDEAMNELYNCGDIFLHISGGEGFGIPYAESMLAGVPCILTDNTTSPELTGGWEFGLPVPVKNTKVLQAYNVLFDIPDIDGAVKQLDFAYQDWKSGGAWLKEAGKKCREFHVKWCDAEAVTDRWEDILYRVIRGNNKVLWHSFFGKGVGFTAISECIIPALERKGYDIYINDWMSASSPIMEAHFKALYDKFLAARGAVDFKQYAQVVCWLMESFETVAGDWKLGWSLCESTKLRDYYTRNCNMMDYIITSSDFNREVQRKSGVIADIRVVPPCIDAAKFPELERPPCGSRPFTFLHIGVIQERKNPDETLAGYCAAFPDDGKTKFILKSNDFGTVDWFRARYAARSDIEFQYTSDKPFTREELLELFRSADCYVNLSHGEGIGMPDIEALATGLPVIGSNWDTRGLFLDDEVGWMVEVSHFEPAYKATVKEDCGDWACFSTESYIKALREAAGSPELAREKGKRGAERVRSLFTPERAADALDEVLMDIYFKKKYGARPQDYDEAYYASVHKYDPVFYEQVALGILSRTEGLGGQVLDLGCGTGYLMKHLLEKGVSVTGIDTSDYAVANPMPECIGRVFKGDALQIPYADQTFDWVVAWSLLEHLPERDVPQALKEIRRVGKAAYFEIAIPLHEGHSEQIAKEDRTHITIKPFDWWEEKFRQVGLEVAFYDGKMNMVVKPKEFAVTPVVKGDRVLVGVPTKDRAASLTRLILSLQEQTFKDFDLVVVDDSRVDDLPANKELNEALSRLYTLGNRWLCVRGVGQNQAVAHNKILAHALHHDYKLVLRLDDDVTIKPDFMERLYNEFLKDTACDYAAMGGILLNPHHSDADQVMPQNWRQMGEFAGTIDPCILHHQIFLYPDDMEYRDDIQHLYSSYMYRPVLLAKVGGYPTNLSAYGFREETMPIYELWHSGYKLRIVCKAVGYHWHAQTGGLRAIPEAKAEELVRQDERVFKSWLKRVQSREYGTGRLKS